MLFELKISTLHVRTASWRLLVVYHFRSQEKRTLAKYSTSTPRHACNLKYHTVTGALKHRIGTGALKHRSWRPKAPHSDGLQNDDLYNATQTRSTTQQHTSLLSNDYMQWHCLLYTSDAADE